MLRSALRSARGALRVEDLDHEETEDVNEGDGDHGGVGEFNNTERDDENGDLNEIAAANNHAVQARGMMRLIRVTVTISAMMKPVSFAMGIRQRPNQWFLLDFDKVTDRVFSCIIDLVVALLRAYILPFRQRLGCYRR